MKYFLDTEFIEAPGRLDLISIGIVCQSGETLYMESSEVDWSHASQWVLDNVRPHLSGHTATRAQIADAVRQFIADNDDGSPVEFWGYFADYDWVVFCWLFGSMIDLPKGFPFYCRDVKQWADMLGVTREQLPPDPAQDHHALADAHWTHSAWRTLHDMVIERVLQDAPPALPFGPLSADAFDALFAPGEGQRAKLAYRALMLDRDNLVRERDEALQARIDDARQRLSLSAPESAAAAASEQLSEAPARPKPICLYHANCADGFTAAWAVWRRFGDAFDYHAATYGEAPPDVSGRDVVLVDFSYKRPVLKEMRASARSILVLDHHKTAAEDLAGGDGFVDTSHWDWRSGGALDCWTRHLRNVEQDGYEGAHNAIYVLFDMDRSGAGIAWDFFHPKAMRPLLVEFAQDRDLWRFALDGSREVSAFIFAHPYQFEHWDAICAKLETDLQGVIDAGAAIEKKHHKDVAELVAVCRREMEIGGAVVPAASLPYTLTSDAGHLMCGEYYSPALAGRIIPPFAACYWDTPAGRVFSLRSREGGFDVSLIAKAYGGGGHKHAAGFTIPYAELTAQGEPPYRIVAQAA